MSEQPAAPDGIGEGEDRRAPSLRALLGYFLRLGSTGFGGPVATVGYMQRDLVERRGWMGRQPFLDGVAVSQTCPGPLAAQVATWVGYTQAGGGGALAVVAAFVAPSFLMVLIGAAVYRHFEGLAVVHQLFRGVAPVVIAIIAMAAYKLAKLTNQKDRRAWVLSAVIAVITAVSGSEPVLLVVAAGLLMLVIDAPPKSADGLRRFFRRHRRPPGAAAGVLLVGAPKGTGPWLVGAASAGVLVSVGLFFFKAGLTVFGSGLAVVPALREGVVHSHHWLTEPQFLDAVAVGLLTPGPIVITATWIGYQVAGVGGAVVATVGIFAPIYLGIVILGRWFVRHRTNPQLRAFVRGATAGAAGAIAGSVVVLGRQSISNVAGVVMAVVALGLIVRFKVKEPLLVGLGAAVGLVLF